MQWGRHRRTNTHQNNLSDIIGDRSPQARLKDLHDAKGMISCGTIEGDDAEADFGGHPPKNEDGASD